jgi:hypothetical protein
MPVADWRTEEEWATTEEVEDAGLVSTEEA